MWIGFETQVQSLVGELKSYKLHSMALKKKKKEEDLGGSLRVT